MRMEDGKNRLQVEKTKIANQIMKINGTFSLFSNVKMVNWFDFQVWDGLFTN